MHMFERLYPVMMAPDQLSEQQDVISIHEADSCFCCLVGGCS